jgi:hypothetical protein
MGKELAKCSFLKSAEGFENRGFNFLGFLQKTEKSEIGVGRGKGKHGSKNPPLQKQETAIDRGERNIAHGSSISYFLSIVNLFTQKVIRMRSGKID